MSVLFCLTPNLECCSDSETSNAASVTRECYLPDGRPVTSDNSPFIRSQVSSAVTLHRNRFSFTAAPSGVYRCEISDTSGTSQNIYVGIYPQGDGEMLLLIYFFNYSIINVSLMIPIGSPLITSLLFDRNSLITLTCTSTGGPPTTVAWKKNGVPVNISLYEQSQRLVDAVEATYQSVLFSDDISNFVGSIFTCEVDNIRVTVPVQETAELNG